MSRSIFDEIASAEVTQRADRIKPGRYIFDVKNLFFGKKRKGSAFIAELIVAEAHAKETGEDGNMIAPTAVGSTVGHMACWWGKAMDSAPGNTKAAICAIFGEDPKDVKTDDFKGLIEELFSEEGLKSQATRGRRVAGETNASVTKEGEARTYLNLSPVSDTFNSTEEIAKRRKAIEAAGAEQTVDVE